MVKKFNISLRRFFDPSRLSVIFVVVPVAAAAAGDGCSSAPEPGPLTPEETLQVVSGNTFKLLNEEIYAFADDSGQLRSRNAPSGGRVGQWRVDGQGQLCALWKEVDNGAETCSVLLAIKDNQVLWAEVDMVILEGNPQEL